MFESSEPGTKTVNPTDSRFFWLANYVQPLFWVALAVLALVRFMFIWLPLVGEFCLPEKKERRLLKEYTIGKPGRKEGEEERQEAMMLGFFLEEIDNTKRPIY